MPVSASFVDYVREQLAELGAVTGRRMFGGVGLYRGGQFFGLIDHDTLYFKVDDRNRGEYQARGMAPFRPYRDRPEVSMSYFQVPVDVIEDAELLTQWARASVRAAVDSPAKSAARKRSNAGAAKPGAATQARKRTPK
jgi:DNA transformation protein